MQGSELRLFLGQSIPPTLNYFCRAPDIAAVGTILNVFSYDAVSGRGSNLLLSRRRTDVLRATVAGPRQVYNYRGSVTPTITRKVTENPKNITSAAQRPS